MRLFRLSKSKNSGLYVGTDGSVANNQTSHVLDFSTGTTDAGKEVTLDFTCPSDPVGQYQLILVNESTVSDLTVKVQTVETNLSTTTTTLYATLTEVTCPYSESRAYNIEGILNKADMRLVASNDSSTLDSQGYYGYARVKELK